MSGSLAAQYAHTYHTQQEGNVASNEQPSEDGNSIVLPIDSGVAHRVSNLTDGIVVDPQAKNRLKFTNEQYLRAHPELNTLISDFVTHVLKTRPDDVQQAAVEWFVEEGQKRSEQEQGQQAS